MDRTRRSFLKGLACAGATAAGTALPAAASEAPRQAPADAVGMLYDTTRCIGCKACVVSCKEANGLPADTGAKGLYDQPQNLNSKTKNIIKLYREDGQESFMKMQCMHCIDPACSAACMIGALQKRAHGIVTWEKSRCIGCRYCQMACPYNVPKFEWESTNPDIVKCEMCDHLIAQGGQPACCEVCPRAAVIYGDYDALLEDARQRITDNPDRYVPKIFGEKDGGGTQVLYVSHIDFDKLGLPELEETGHADLNRSIQHGVYKGMIAPVALFAVLGGVIIRNRNAEKDAGGES